MNNIDAMFQNPAFDCLDNNTKASLKALYISLQGKTTEQAIPMIIGFLKSMPKDIKLTKEQKEAILSVISAPLSESDRKKLNMLLNMLGY